MSGRRGCTEAVEGHSTFSTERLTTNLTLVRLVFNRPVEQGRPPGAAVGREILQRTVENTAAATTSPLRGTHTECYGGKREGS